MKHLKKISIRFLLGFLLLGFTTNVMAQDRAAAVTAHNKARELLQAKEYNKAIEMYTQAITQAQQLEDSNQILKSSQKGIVDAYYSLAVVEYKELQKNQSYEQYDETINSFNEALDIAEEYEIEGRVEQISSIIPQLYNKKGTLAYKKGDYDLASQAINQAIKLRSNYATAYYQLALVKKNQENISNEEIISAFKKSLEVGNNVNNASVIRESKEQLSGLYLTRGHDLVSNQNNVKQGIELYKQALEYEPNSSQIYFRLAQAYNKIQNWSDALENAKRAIELENRGKTTKAKSYFELGIAYQGLGNKSEACNALENARYGNFKSSAEHKMEFELECNKTTN